MPSQEFHEQGWFFTKRQAAPPDLEGLAHALPRLSPAHLPRLGPSLCALAQRSFHGPSPRLATLAQRAPGPSPRLPHLLKSPPRTQGLPTFAQVCARTQGPRTCTSLPGPSLPTPAHLADRRTDRAEPPDRPRPGTGIGGGRDESERLGLNLSGSWQQGHSATYNTQSRI